MKITFFGVGGSKNLYNDNTYFLIEDGNNNLQVDAGGGLGLMREIKYKNIKFNNIFITHKHTDHLLGFFHLIKVFSEYCGEKLNIYCSEDVEKSIMIISNAIGGKVKKVVNSSILNFYNINDLLVKNVGEFKLIPINLNSQKIEQFGFLLEVNNKKILFFGDEGSGVLNRDDLDLFLGVDYLIIESLIPE